MYCLPVTIELKEQLEKCYFVDLVGNQHTYYPRLLLQALAFDYVFSFCVLEAKISTNSFSTHDFWLLPQALAFNYILSLCVLEAVDLHKLSQHTNIAYKHNQAKLYCIMGFTF